MFKKILLSAAALSSLFLFASQAEAGYGYGYSYGYGHYKPHHRSYSYYKSAPSLLLLLQAALLLRDQAGHHPRVGRLFLLVLLQDHLSRLPDLQLADPGSPGAPHRLGQSGAAVFPPRRQPFFLARISSRPPNDHRERGLG